MYGALKGKSSENKLQFEMNNIKDDIFENIKNPKITPKTQKPKKSQNLKVM